MGLFRKTREEKLDKYRKGINAILTFPKSVDNTETNNIEDYASGRSGLAATCGSVNGKVHGKICLASDCLIFDSGETGELCIPYEDIVGFDGGDAGFGASGILLSSGKKVLISVYVHNRDIYDFITEFAKRKQDFWIINGVYYFISRYSFVYGHASPHFAHRFFPFVRSISFFMNVKHFSALK